VLHLYLYLLCFESCFARSNALCLDWTHQPTHPTFHFKLHTANSTCYSAEQWKERPRQPPTSLPPHAGEFSLKLCCRVLLRGHTTCVVLRWRRTPRIATTMGLMGRTRLRRLSIGSGAGVHFHIAFNLLDLLFQLINFLLPPINSLFDSWCAYGMRFAVWILIATWQRKHLAAF